MNKDPLTAHVSNMQKVKVSEKLREVVLEQADKERLASQQNTAEDNNATSSYVSSRASQKQSYSAHSRNATHLLRFKGYAVAACLAALSIAVGASLALPQFMGSLASSGSFTIKAYGAIDDTLFPTGTSDIIAFNCETTTQRFVSNDPKVYANEGLYTGCVFSIEGENIARIQANTSRGEIYHETNEVYSIESDVQLAKEANEWKQTRIGQGELLGKYDYIAHDLFYERVNVDDENVGKLRGDPSTFAKINLYQRLGATVDTSTSSATNEGENLTNFAFGLWTNLPFEPTATDPIQTFNTNDNVNAALDTLDGAQLTLTITFTDGSYSTKVIDLKAADFKANVVTVANGQNKMLELVPQIVGTSNKSAEEKRADYEQGIASIHTLYGSVVSETSEPFPCGEASYPELSEPLTKPTQINPSPAAQGHSTSHGEEATKPTIKPQNLTTLENTPPYETERHSYINGNSALISTKTKFLSVETLPSLPEGMALNDLVGYYPQGWEAPGLDQLYFEELDCTLFADGTLSPGYSLAMVTKTVTNTSDEQGDIFVTDGFFATIEKEVDSGGWHPFARQDMTEPLWRSGHDGPSWDAHRLFQIIEPGETVEISVLYIVADEALRNPDFAFVYHQWDGIEDTKAFHLGALL